MTGIDDVVATIHAMRVQEDTDYHCHAGLPQDPIVPGVENPVDASCRSKMIKWCYEIVDHCKFKRETVSMSTSFLDRFVLTAAGQEATKSRKCYQLAAMACLYTAVKLFEPQAMDPKIISALSRGVYTEKEVTDMELLIINALRWRLNPPTAISFVRLYLSLMKSSSMTKELREEIFQLAVYQTELALSDIHLITMNPSTVALACTTNALESCDDLSCSLKQYYLNVVSNATSIDTSSPDVLFTQKRLQLKMPNYVGFDCLVVSQPASPSPSKPTRTVERKGSWKVSPRSVVCDI